MNEKAVIKKTNHLVHLSILSPAKLEELLSLLKKGG